jgi:hypothetical protein
MSFGVDLIGWEWYQDQRNNDVNLFYDPANGYNKDPRIFGRPNPDFGQVVPVTSDGKRDYLALASSFSRRLRNDFQAGLTYTCMFHMRDDNLGGSGAIGSTASNPFNNLAGEWARSTDFQRHTVRTYWLYQLPWSFSVSGVFLRVGQLFPDDVELARVQRRWRQPPESRRADLDSIRRSGAVQWTRGHRYRRRRAAQRPPGFLAAPRGPAAGQRFLAGRQVQDHGHR